MKKNMLAEKTCFEESRSTEQSLVSRLEESEVQGTEFTKGLLVQSRRKRDLLDSAQQELASLETSR